MWWPESTLILTLNKSKQYQRVLICIYLIVMVTLWTSTGWLAFKIAGSLYLLCQGIPFIHKSVPTVQPMHLIYQNQRWFWQLLLEEPSIELSEVKLLVNTGLFLLVKIHPVNQRKTTKVIFHDQLNAHQLRRFLWLMYV